MGCIGACVRQIELFPMFFTPCAVECVKACDAQGCIALLLLRLQAGTTAKPMRRLPPLLYTCLFRCQLFCCPSQPCSHRPAACCSAIMLRLVSGQFSQSVMALFDTLSHLLPFLICEKKMVAWCRAPMCHLATPSWLSWHSSKPMTSPLTPQQFPYWMRLSRWACCRRSSMSSVCLLPSH